MDKPKKGTRGTRAMAATPAPEDDEALIDLEQGDEQGAPGGWRQRTLERSLKTARARAVSRSDRFIASAFELLMESGGTDFTVQEIVERSKMSLRSFYQHFGSKDELLLALFEEAIAQLATQLRAEVEAVTDPVEQLRRYVDGLFGTVEESMGPGSRALTLYHLRLAETHPEEFAQALSPQAELLQEIVEAGVAAGAFRDDLSVDVLTVLLDQTLVASMQLRVIGAHVTGAAIGADQLWRFCLGAVSPPAPPRARARRRPTRP